jgi:hypothetical protein
LPEIGFLTNIMVRRGYLLLMIPTYKSPVNADSRSCKIIPQLKKFRIQLLLIGIDPDEFEFFTITRKLQSQHWFYSIEKI